MGVLKKKIDDDSNETDPQLIGSLMYLVNTILYSCHAMNVLVISWVNQDILSRQQQNMYWDIYEAQLDMAWDMPPVWTWVRRICRYRVSREYSGLDENIWLLFYCEGCHGFLVQWETNLCGLECHRSIVYIIECVKQCDFINFRQIYLIMRWILWL